MTIRQLNHWYENEDSYGRKSIHRQNTLKCTNAFDVWNICKVLVHVNLFESKEQNNQFIISDKP